MSSRTRRLGLLAVIVALGAGVWWGLGVPNRISTDGAVEGPASASPPPPPEFRRLDSTSELRAWPPRAAGVEDRWLHPAGEGATSAPRVHRVHVRLPDGSDATEGTVEAWWLFFSNPPNTDYALDRRAKGRIGPGGIAELSLADASEGIDELLVDVPGQPTYLHRAARSAEPIEVRLPRRATALLAGTVVDADGRGLPDLPILVTSGTASESAVFAADLDFEARRVGAAGIHYVHVETRTDARGAFSADVPTTLPDRWTRRVESVRIVSRDPSWFLSPAVEYAMTAKGSDAAPVVAIAVPAVTLDVRLSATGRQPIVGPWFAAGVVAGAHPGWRVELELPRPVFERADTAPMAERTTVRLPRPVPVGEAFELVVAASADGLDPLVRRVAIPAGVTTASVDLPLDDAGGDERTGLVELTLPDLSGPVGTPIEHSLDLVTADGSALRVRRLNGLRWSAEHRTEARLPPGAWLLRLRPYRHDDVVALEARVDVAPRVTTRATMEVPPSR